MSGKPTKGSGGSGGKRGGGAAGSGATINPSGRQLTVRVKTAARRSVSSTRWLQRQLNDPYVTEAKKRGYRSRAAFKLLQLDEKFKLLRPGMRIVDLGAAPGGWTQIAVDVAKPGTTGARVVGMDILEMEPVAGATILLGDFMADDAPDRLIEALDGPADLVMSDMAAPTTGHPPTDHIRIMAMAELAYDFARTVLTEGGAFVCKVFQGGTERGLLEQLKRDFKTVRHAKPPASRAESAETYVVAQGFRRAE
ncbi:MAG TPA: RlmE family RNA methyltransferase [Azospirillaceae bacterium]|nr:RlmE family RNA methyltransferase [Azospirillaceae bacterium]